MRRPELKKVPLASALAFLGKPGAGRCFITGPERTWGRPKKLTPESQRLKKTAERSRTAGNAEAHRCAPMGFRDKRLVSRFIRDYM